MARLTLPDFDGPYPQYYSYVLSPTGNTVLGQIRSITPSDSIQTEQVGRVGSSTKKTLKKSKETAVELELWIDSDLAELAVALNQTAPSSGTTLKLDPSASPTNLFIQNFDSENTAATLLSTIYMVQYLATELEFGLDEDGEQVATISGTLEELYWKRA
jgi:hypothetical protein